MHPTSIDLYRIALPLRQPLPMSFGEQKTLETVLVAMHADGATGWGEASPGNSPTKNAEWAAGVFAVLRDWLAPVVVGKEIDTGDSLAETLKPFQGNPYAKSGLDCAWWDLNARQKGQPLYQMLAGDKARTTFEVAPTFDQMESPDALHAALSAAVEAGFNRVQLKIRPGWDYRMVEYVRKEFASLNLHLDCEAGLTLAQDDTLFRLEDFMPTMIEQPLAADDLVGHAMLQESLHTPLGLDESIGSIAQAEMALELKSGQFISLKPGRVGGLTPCLAIHDRCHDACTPCWAAATPQTAIGCRTDLALGAKENCEYPAEFFAADQVLAADVAEQLLPTKDADGLQRIHLPAAPGIGIDPNPAALDRFCIEHATIQP